MNTLLFRILLLGSAAIFLLSCGADGGSVSSTGVKLQDSLLTIQAGRLMTLQQAIDINGKAMERPFQADQSGSNGEATAPAKSPLDGLPEDRLMAFKGSFSKIRSRFDSALAEHQVLIDEVIGMQKLLYDAQNEINTDAVTAETKTALGQIPDQITTLQGKIDVLEAKIKEIQKEALNFLMSEDFLQPGASWLMVNSPLI